MKRIFLLGCILVLPAPSYAWSVEGHEVVVMVAQAHLKTKAKKAITRILSPGSVAVPELADYVTWADDLRAKETGESVVKTAPHFFALPEADAEYPKVVAAFPGNKTWHFVNLPVSATVYTKIPGSPTDVVEAIGRCVQILEDKSTDAFHQKWALIFLIHLVGDLHQPLHCVEGYFDLSDAKHPIFHDHEVAGDVGDGGANGLLVMGEPPKNGGEAVVTTLALHHFWDDNLVGGLDAKAQKVADSLTVAPGKNTGNYEDWPAQWVQSSLIHAKEVYHGLEFGAATKDAKGHWQIPATLPGGEKGYAQAMNAAVREQLARGGFDLADLLNKIKWATPDGPPK